MLVLHDYFRSSASHRVRIALRLKGLPYRQAPHHLRKGEQRAPGYLALNPQGFVPALEHDGLLVPQSVAIMEYLDEAFPGTPPLLPADAAGRARVRSLAAIAASDTHPLNNSRVLSYLEHELGLDEAARTAWNHRWQTACFDAFEARLSREAATGRFCHGDAPGMADCCLVAQIVNAGRVAFDLAPYPTVRRIRDAAMALDAFREAMPERQPDAE